MGVLNMTKQTLFPPLPIDEWEETKDTVHLFLQIVGKVRLATHPKMNHWWHVPFYVSTRGLTTGTIPYDATTVFEMEFDFVDHVLRIEVIDLAPGNSGSAISASRTISLENISVAEFYQQTLLSLRELGIDVEIRGVPYDVPAVSTKPFATDYSHATYDPEYMQRMWRILVQVDSIFEEFRGRFLGKSTLVHIYWHHFDLALTRFSGKAAPAREGVNQVEAEAYSHEVISFGFWAGDDQVRAPAFYAYAYPVPDGIYDEPLRPAEAFWNEEAGMALMMYDDIRTAQDPRQKVLDFLESTYEAGARRAHWDMEAFAVPA